MTAFSRKYYRSLAPFLDPYGSRRPYDWPEIFGRQAPLELEIGFGNGEYLNRVSQENPGRDYVGLEIAWASIKRALRRLFAPPRPNVKVMQLPAQVALAYYFQEKSLQVIRAFFPVPWPGDKGIKKRLFQEKFLNLAASRLAADGVFELVTDSHELALWTLAEAKNSALNFTMKESPALLDTKYERKWQGGGQEIFYHLTGRKKFQPELAMANGDVEMQAYYLENFDPDNYQPQGSQDSTVVKFHELIFDRQKQEGLLRVLVVEEYLKQEFFIKIRKHEKGWKFSPAICSHLVPTQGVARALELATAA